MIDERWKLIEDYEDYAVSTMGRVYSIKKDIMLKPDIGKRGYYRVQFKYKGKRYLVHRLVGLAFKPNYFNLPEIDHIDRDRSNNSVNNLRWASRKMNNDNRDLGDFNTYQQAQSHLATPIKATNIDTGEIKFYDYLMDARREFGGGVLHVLKGRAKTCKGHTFSYI